MPGCCLPSQTAATALHLTALYLKPTLQQEPDPWVAFAGGNRPLLIASTEAILSSCKDTSIPQLNKTPARIRCQPARKSSPKVSGGQPAKDLWWVKCSFNMACLSILCTSHRALRVHGVFYSLRTLRAQTQWARESFRVCFRAGLLDTLAAILYNFAVIPGRFRVIMAETEDIEQYRPLILEIPLFDKIFNIC
jgi:hypothetical protein